MIPLQVVKICHENKETIVNSVISVWNFHYFLHLILLLIYLSLLDNLGTIQTLVHVVHFFFLTIQIQSIL